MLALTALGAEIDVYVREGCPHCADAERFLDALQHERPDLEVTYHDVATSPEARAALAQVSEAQRVTAPGVPSFVVGEHLIVGFADDRRTGERIVALLDGRAPEAPSVSSDVCAPELPCSEPVGDGPEAGVELPLFGRIDAREIGLPLFTILLGLVDGFNPCATWVLLFLLSVLVRMKSRARMALVAGTFVVVSGLVYYAFMVAWLNLFFLFGISRAISLVLALLALVIGAAGVRDGLAREGFTLTIPARLKPAIMARSRTVSQAASLPAALAGVAVLALLVNVVELLCTAGLPAMYTHVLAQRDLSAGSHYAWIALYILAYVVDDGLMVGVAVFTLSRTRLQERGGRILKLVSGVVMLALGSVLLWRPSWLAFAG